MPDPTLLMLANDVRGKTLRLLDGVTAEMARFVPAGLNNSTLWHAGHSLVVVEHLGITPVTGKPGPYPAAWFEAFKWKSEPAKVTAWPALSEVVAALQGQLARLTNQLAGLTDEQLDRVIDADRNRTLRYSIMHALHDESGHQGEIWLLKKLYNVREAAAAAPAKSAG